MEELEFLRKVEELAKRWSINPKEKKLLLTGRDLTKGLELITNGNDRFMLKREIAFIKKSKSKQGFFGRLFS